MNSTTIPVKKEHKSKDKKIVITSPNNLCSYLLYYDNGEIKKAKAFYYPLLGSPSQKKKVDKNLRREYKLWLHCLWYYGYLEEDDVQLIEFQTLDKSKKI